MFVNILPHESSCGQYLEYKKLDKYIFMIMFHTDDKSLPQIIISLPQMIIFVSHGLHRFIPADHSPFKRRTNQSSPLQGELEGVGNQKHNASHILTSLPSPLKGRGSLLTCGKTD